MRALRMISGGGQPRHRLGSGAERGDARGGQSGLREASQGDCGSAVVEPEPKRELEERGQRAP